VTPLAITVTLSGSTYTATRVSGTVVSSGTNAATVIQAALNGLTSGRTAKERVLVQASATISTRINMVNYSVLELANGVVFRGGENQMIGCSASHDWEIFGGEWVCTSTAATQGVQPMMFTGATECILRDCKVRNCKYNNIQFNNSNGCVVSNVESYQSTTLNNLECGPPTAPNPRQCNQNGWHGLIFATVGSGTCNDNLVEGCYFHDMGHGGTYFYADEAGTGAMNNNKIRNCLVERCGTSGLSISQRSRSGGVAHYNEIYDNVLTDCGQDSQHPYINIGYRDNTNGCTPTANCTNNKVHHNTIWDNGLLTYTPEGSTVQYGSYSGINVQGNNNEIYRNDIGGSGVPIDLICGTGNYIHENYCHDVTKHSEFYTHAIHDVGCSSSTIENNVCYNLVPTSGTAQCVFGTDSTDTVTGNTMLTSPPAAGEYGARDNYVPPDVTGGPVMYTWTVAPTTATMGVNNYYEMHFQVSDDGGATYRNPGPTGLHFEFTPPDGSAVHVGECTTSSGVCSVIFHPDVLGAWTCRVRWDWLNTTFEHTWSAPISINVTEGQGTTYETIVSVSGSTFTARRVSDNFLFYSGTSANAAIAAAVNNTSSTGWVGIGAGAFGLTATLNGTRNIQGAGMTVTRLFNAGIATAAGSGANAMVNLSSGVYFGDLELDGMAGTRPFTWTSGGTGANAVAGIRLWEASNCNVYNINIHDIPCYYGVEFWNCSGNHILNVTVNGVGTSTTARGYGNGFAGGVGNFSGANMAHDNLIENCTVSNCTMVCFNWEPGYNNEARNCTFTSHPNGMFLNITGATIASRCMSVWGVSGFNPSSGNEFNGCHFNGRGLLATVNGPLTTFSNCVFNSTGTAPATDSAAENYAVILVNGNNTTTNYGRGCTFTSCSFTTVVSGMDGIRFTGTSQTYNSVVSSVRSCTFSGCSPNVADASGQVVTS
jgi:hypothetical protein